MTTHNDMTKTELNDLLPENLRCKNAAQLKKTSKQDLIDMLERRDATQAEAAALAKQPKLTDLEQRVTVAYLAMGIDCNGCETLDDMLADNMTWGDVPAIAKATGLTQKQVQGVIASLDKKGLLVITDEGVNGEGPVQQVLSDDGLRVAFDLLADGVEAKPAKAPRKLEARTYCEPCADIADLKPIRAGTKRAILAEALAKGATIEQLCDATGWNRATVQSAFRTDLKPMGYGVHRDDAGVYWLDLPKKAKRPAIREKGETAEEVLVAACR